MTGPVTLGDLIREKKLLWTYCRDCRRERDVDPATIPLPPEFPVPEVGNGMKCSACGSRVVETKQELYPGGIEAMRSRHNHAERDQPHCLHLVEMPSDGCLRLRCAVLTLTGLLGGAG